MLAKVRGEAGPGARVLEAKKVRDGGIGGFFSRERFVLTVEVTDQPSARPRKAEQPLAPEAAPPSSILELADLMDEAEARDLTFAGARPTAARREPERLAPLPPIAAPAPLFRTAPFDHERVVQVATVREPEPIPSTESASFHDVLARLAHATDLPVEPAPAAEAEVIETIDVSSLAFERFDVASFTVVDEVLDEPAVVVEPSLVVTDEPAPMEAVEVEEVVPVPELLEPAIAEETQLAVTSNPLVRVRRTPSTFERTIGMGLLELGVPAAYVPDIEGAFSNDDVRDAIMTALRLPKPPALPLGNNAIVAVVGERRAAINLAEKLADEPALNGAIVKVADRQGFTLIDGGSATADERGVRQRPRRTVVAVPSVPGMTGEWTRDLLDRLEPDMVWGVVPASRKSEDVASWAIQLGGLDVLALTGLDKTVSPATTLRLGIPVGLLDGRCATTEAWADLLTARLAA